MTKKTIEIEAPPGRYHVALVYDGFNQTQSVKIDGKTVYHGTIEDIAFQRTGEMTEEKFDSTGQLIAILQTKGLDHFQASNVVEAHAFAVRNRALQELRRRIHERSLKHWAPPLELTTPATEELIWVLTQIQELEAAR